MAMAGGAMEGYCATGRLATEMTPARMMRMAATQASTGRSIKKRDMGRP